MRQTPNLFGLLAACSVLGICSPARGEATPTFTVGQAVDLRVTHQLNGQGTKRPIIATTEGGNTYVIWRFNAAENPPTPAGIPLIPDRFTFATSRPQWASVPGVSVFDGKTWSEPQRLAGGVRECEAVAAWCVNEQLHLLVTATFEEQVGHHLRYDPAQKQWEHLHTLAVSPSNASHFVQRGQTLHVVSMLNGVKYWRFDGRTWSKPVPMDSEARDRPALAVGDDGVVHLCWHGVDGGTRVGYAAIAADGSVQLFKTELPIHGDQFDLAIGLKGELLIAYQAELPDGHPDHDAVCIRSWAANRWAEPTLIGKDAGLIAGGVRLISVNKSVLLTWNHRARQRQGNMVTIGPVRSVAIFNGTSWSTPQPAARLPRGGGILAGGGFGAAHFPDLHADAKGRVHMAWANESSCHHAVIADLSRSKPSN